MIGPNVKLSINRGYTASTILMSRPKWLKVDQSDQSEMAQSLFILGVGAIQLVGYLCLAHDRTKLDYQHPI